MWSDSDHQYSVSGIGESAAVLAAAYNETETTEGDVAARKARKLLQASDVVADVVGEVGAHWELMTSADAKMDVIIDGQPVQQQVEHCTEHWLILSGVYSGLIGAGTIDWQLCAPVGFSWNYAASIWGSSCSA